MADGIANTIEQQSLSDDACVMYDAARLELP